MPADGEFERATARSLAAELDESYGPHPRWSDARAAGSPDRPPIGRVIPVLFAAAIVLMSSLLGVALLAGGSGVMPSQSAAQTPNASATASGDIAASLHRPLLAPAMGPIGACPATPIGLTLESLGEFQGTGPVRVNNLNDVPIYKLPNRNGWYGQKVFWAVDARERGPLLVRVVRMDAPGEVGLGTDQGSELILSNDSLDPYSVVGKPPPYPLERIFVDGVSFKEPGCYFMQIDGVATTSTIVFRAMGTR